MYTPRSLPLALALASALTSLGCGRTITGSGRVATESRYLPAFTGVEVDSGVRVSIVAGSAYGVTLTGDDNLLPQVRTSVHGERLVVRPVADRVLRPRGDLHVTIGLPELKLLSVGGGSEVDATAIASASLRLECRGGCRLTASGGTADLDVLVTGGAELEAGELIAAHLEVEAEGGAFAKLTATSSARGRASGGATLLIGGQPSVRDIGASTSATVIYR